MGLFGIMTAPDLTGQSIGKWTVGGMAYDIKSHQRLYRCKCACGSEKLVKHSHLFDGKTKSCGCSWTTHGMSNSNEYKIWESMLGRCRNTSHHAYNGYGGRGITVCDKWTTFAGFFEDMGLKPSKLTLERIDNNLGYSKDNCKWATRTEQARNTRATKLTEEIVVTIKRLISQGVSQSKIASMFNVSRGNIGHIAQGATWA